MRRTPFNARSSAMPGCSQRDEDQVLLGEQPIMIEPGPRVLTGAGHNGAIHPGFREDDTTSCRPVFVGEQRRDQGRVVLRRHPLTVWGDHGVESPYSRSNSSRYFRGPSCTCAGSFGSGALQVAATVAQSKRATSVIAWMPATKARSRTAATRASCNFDTHSWN